MPLGHGPANGRNRPHRRHRSSTKIGWAVHRQKLTTLVDLAKRGLVHELLDGGHDPAPGSRAVVIAGERQFVSASRALLECVVTIALEYELRRPPNVDLGYQSGRLMKLQPGPPMTLGNAANAKVRL